MSEITSYGVWAGLPQSYVVQTQQQDPESPHVTLKFRDSSTEDKEAAINVKSTDADTRLVYWHDGDFQHPITETLIALDLGFHLATSNQTGILSLDYIRTQPQVLVIDKGKILPTQATGPDNDIEDDVKAILDHAISMKATIYIFGSSYNTGIHDIHMNQGSLPKYDNGVGQDGALIFSFPDKRFEAVFLAFASQKIPTDHNTGEPLSNSKTLIDIIGGSGSSQETTI